MAELELRPAAPADQEECGRILYAAFADIAERHGFPPDFATPEIAHGMMGFILGHSFGVVAEQDGRVLGSNFLREDEVSGVGPISVDPTLQQSGVGRALMQAVLDRAEQRGAASVRLVQDAFNATSMALYAGMGFAVREPLVLVEGTPRSGPDPALQVRPLEEGDLAECTALCRKVHGVERHEELRQSIGRLGPFVAERDGRITAYASSVGFWPAAHGVAESDRDLRGLIAGAVAATGRPAGFLLPTRQESLFRWALGEGLRIVKPLTLMSLGPYQEPTGSFFPSVLY